MVRDSSDGPLRSLVEVLAAVTEAVVVAGDDDDFGCCPEGEDEVVEGLALALALALFAPDFDPEGAGPRPPCCCDD